MASELIGDYVGLVRSYTILENEQNSSRILRGSIIYFLTNRFNDCVSVLFIMSLPPPETSFVSFLLDKSLLDRLGVVGFLKC